MEFSKVSNLIKTIFEDSNVLGVDKPSGLVVHSDGRTQEETLTNFLEQNYPELEKVGNPHTLDSGRYTDRWGILNRLDRDTSGIILIAKNQESFLNLQKQFLDRKVEKKYVATVHGVVDENEIEKLLNQNKIFKTDMTNVFEIHESFTRHKKDPRIWVLKSDVGSRNSIRDALTNFKVLSVDKNFSKILFMPVTGRTHQLRLHAKFIGHPILGDKKYSFGGIDNLTEIDRTTALQLRAISLKFIHPITKKEMEIVC